eukprot:Pompholyxophrys_punicea_v1_NODE_41_length_4663_cov_8.672092.p2 type:complete len:143 gc:universal NODE_41_length_4663_cov_8.672092:2020-2448(+)
MFIKPGNGSCQPVFPKFFYFYLIFFLSSVNRIFCHMVFRNKGNHNKRRPCFVDGPAVFFFFEKEAFVKHFHESSAHFITVDVAVVVTRSDNVGIKWHCDGQACFLGNDWVFSAIIQTLFDYSHTNFLNKKFFFPKIGLIFIS